VTPFIDMIGYRRFGGPCSMVFWGFGILPHYYTISQPRRPRLESSSPWELQVSSQITCFRT